MIYRQGTAPTGSNAKEEFCTFQDMTITGLLLCVVPVLIVL